MVLIHQLIEKTLCNLKSLTMKNEINPCLWFNGEAKEAAEFYSSVFDKTKIITDTPLIVEFKLAGIRFTCINGGPHFKPNPSISFYVICDTEQEIDGIWNKLIEQGTILMPLEKFEWSQKYGWVQDRYGFSWQLSLENAEGIKQKITPCLLFTGDQFGKAEEAIQLYTSIFSDSGIDSLVRYGIVEMPNNEMAIKHAQISLDKQKFMVLESNLTHDFSFNEAISLMVNCSNQDEIDYYWNLFTFGGEEGNGGWLKDRFGVSWQIVPTILGKLMTNPNKAENVIQSFRHMKKLEIEKLENA
jgi:predicted 3-demethylubiquinone-9 3-methyltransferase (glyoxalase superfamily)